MILFNIYKVQSLERLIYLVSLFLLLVYSKLPAQTLLWTQNFAATAPAGWTTVNAGSGNNWSLISTTNPFNGSYCATYRYHVSNAANAWFFTAGVNMTAGYTYRIEFQQRVTSATYTEKLKVTIGNAQTVASQTTTLYDNNSLTNTTYSNRVSSDFIPSSSGTYYFGFQCYSAADMYDLHIDNIRAYETAPPTPSFHNTSANGTSQTSFNTCRANNGNPPFTISTGVNANRIMIELNTNSSFTGTAYTQTFTGVYNAGTKYDLYCNALSSSLPVGTYFCRTRSSSDGGATWSAYSSSLWVYTYATSAPFGYHHTAQKQFDSPNSTLVTANWDNFISTSNNSTTNNAGDDFFILGQGSSTNSLTTAGDQALTEGSSHYSGASHSCITVGYYTASGSSQDYHGFRFQSTRIPQAATILTASFSCFAHTGSGCGGSSNTTNAMFMKIRGESVDNCAAWASGTNTLTGSPRYRIRTTAGVDWDVPSGASQQWSTGLLLNAPDATSVVQEIVNRPGYAAGNSTGLIVDHDAAAGAYWRYFATMYANANYKASLKTTFNNFYNELRSPNFDLNWVPSATNWDQLYFTNDLTGCGTCNITYYVYNAANNALIASGSSSPFSVPSSAASVYVVARIFRSNTGTFTPKGLDFTLTTNSTILPVELTSFTSSCQQNINYFKWSVESETNCKKYTLEKSSDGYQFDNIKSFDCELNYIGKKEYSYNYYETDNSIKYFRLKQEDVNGNYVYYKTNFIACGSVSKKTYIFPNPSNSDVIYKNESLTPNKAYTVSVINVLGEKILEETFTLNEDEYTMNIETSKLAPGTYIINVYDNTMNMFDSQKFIKN